eukprot:scaffold468_cov216-Pinguiococcus_pyrenoidosus.AAC.2
MGDADGDRDSARRFFAAAMRSWMSFRSSRSARSLSWVPGGVSRLASAIPTLSGSHALAANPQRRTSRRGDGRANAASLEQIYLKYFE